MSELERKIVIAKNCIDALLDTPIGILKHWAKEHPEKAVQLKSVLSESLVNKSQIKKEAKTKSGDTLILSIEREDDLYAVDYCGLAGYDVTFHCVGALAAEKLFEALQDVSEIDAD
jgi:hypothetical protein